MSELPELSTDEEAPTPDLLPEAPEPGDAGPPAGAMSRMRRRSVVVAGFLVVAMVAGAVGSLAGGVAEGLFLPPLAPDDALVKVQQERDTAKLSDLRARFPRDPRVLFLAAFAVQDRGESEKLLRAALEERRVLRSRFPDGKLEAHVRSLLARLLRERSADAEAAEALRPSCGPELAPIADRAGLPEYFVTDVCTGAR